jgi:peroxiredoxin
MALAPGTQAPDFTLKTIGSEGLADFTLSSNFGKKPTVILFFPLAFTVLQGIPCFAWIGKLKPIYQRIADRFSGAGLPSYAN